MQQLAAQCCTDDALDLMSPQQLTNHLLADIDQLKITYDTVQNKIVELFLYSHKLAMLFKLL